MKHIVTEVDGSPDTFREDDLPLLQLGLGPLRQLQAGQLPILGLDEVIQPPAELRVIEQVARLRQGLKDDVLL